VRATTITPVLRYRDVGVASHWLCEAFGFQEHNRAQELGGHVKYVSLRLGDSFVLVRPIINSVLDNLMVQPETVGGANTQLCYLTIADATDHCAHAKAAGATIELEPQDDGLGVVSTRAVTWRAICGALARKPTGSRMGLPAPSNR